ncbi:E3 ubiquitin-protein ligase Mdm2 isoform X2 [Dendroctonus ponderosae]|uniref:E3 ubiquitin-protein ligase Mdm2 isoform X2 n=1 Tax=Dendroctonus ponderosae TaxID=77166 RepID=UPI00203501D7|nr:E3 ubiquitin-protein ligase Mdm2 isoform X2 [Dendroctonus ponderosae]
MSVTVTMDRSPGCSLTVVTQGAKRPRTSGLFYYVRLASESSQNSDDESVCSLQSYETATLESDNRSSDSDATESSGSDEYELVASPEGSAHIEYSSTDSETERIIINSVVTSPLMELNKTESSGVEDSSPEEALPLSRVPVPSSFEMCKRCKSLRCYPLLKLCRKCHKERRRHVLPRVKKRRKKLSKSAQKGKRRKVDPQASARKLITQKELEITQERNRLKTDQIMFPVELVWSNAGASGSSEPRASSASTSGNSALTQSSGIFSGPSTSKGTATDSDEDDLPIRITYKLKDLCIICETAPKDCAFLHQTIAHRCCCYSCAKYISETSRRCPTCNRMITRIVRLFTT